MVHVTATRTPEHDYTDDDGQTRTVPALVHWMALCSGPHDDGTPGVHYSPITIMAKDADTLAPETLGNLLELLRTHAQHDLDTEGCAQLSHEIPTLEVPA